MIPWLLCLAFAALVSAQCDGTEILPLGQGDDGEVIAFNPVDGLIYHTSGWTVGNEWFHVLDVSVPSAGPNLIPGNTYPNPPVQNEIVGMVWDASNNYFITMDRSLNVLSLTSSGTFALLSTFAGSPASSSYIRGFAMSGSNVVGVNPFGGGIDGLVTFNPNTGAVVSSVDLTELGTPVEATGLSRHPDGDLYVLWKVSGMTRALGRVDESTGVITNLGTLGPGGGWAGLTFDDAGQMFVVKGDGGGNGLFSTFPCAPPLFLIAPTE